MRGYYINERDIQRAHKMAHLYVGRRRGDLVEDAIKKYKANKLSAAFEELEDRGIIVCEYVRENGIAIGYIREVKD